MSYTVYNHRYIVNAAVRFREDILFGPSLPALNCTSEIRSHLVIVPRNEGDLQTAPLEGCAICQMTTRRTALTRGV